MAIAKEQIRQIITENNFTNVADVYAYFKEGFKDILQELMEAKMAAFLGYEKIRRVTQFLLKSAMVMYLVGVFKGVPKYEHKFK